jgi:sulfur carrier protein
MTTRLTLNGDSYETEAATLLALASEVAGKPLDDTGHPVDGSRLGIAVALDSAVVPRSRWAATSVPDRAHVEIVTAKQGG